MVDVPYNPDTDVDKFHLLGGRTIRLWADLEQSLWHLVADFLGVDQFRARIVMASITNARAQRELIIRLGETYLDEDFLPEFRSLMKRIKTASEKRNLFAHASMHINPNGHENRVFRDVFDGDTTGLSFRFEPFPPNHLKVLNRALAQLQKDLIFFVVKIDGKVHSSAKIHREPQDDPTQ